MDRGAWWAAVHGVAKSRKRLSDFTFPFHFHALEKEVATHSSVLAWKIPETGETGGLPSVGLHRVGHDWNDLAAAAAVDHVEKAMAAHSSALAWKIPWMEEPGGLQSVGSLRVGHYWVTSLTCIGEGNGNPLQCSCLENPRDGGAWWAAVSGVSQSRTRLKRLSSSSSSSGPCLWLSLLDVVWFPIYLFPSPLVNWDSNVKRTFPYPPFLKKIDWLIFGHAGSLLLHTGFP